MCAFEIETDSLSCPAQSCESFTFLSVSFWLCITEHQSSVRVLLGTHHTDAQAPSISSHLRILRGQQRQMAFVIRLEVQDGTRKDHPKDHRGSGRPYLHMLLLLTLKTFLSMQNHVPHCLLTTKNLQDTWRRLSATRAIIPVQIPQRIMLVLVRSGMGIASSTGGPSTLCSKSFR